MRGLDQLYSIYVKQNMVSLYAFFISSYLITLCFHNVNKSHWLIFRPPGIPPARTKFQLLLNTWSASSSIIYNALVLLVITLLPLLAVGRVEKRFCEDITSLKAYPV